MADIDRVKVVNRSANAAYEEVERRRAAEEERALSLQEELYGEGVRAVDEEGQPLQPPSRKSKSKVKGSGKHKKKKKKHKSKSKGKKRGGVSSHLVEKQLEYKRARREWRNHKARQQVDEVLGKLPTDEEEGLYYNIWYNKHCGFAHNKDRMRGADCQFKHHLPELEDADLLPVTHDCFGREKHKIEREDMGGVGSFNRDCRTLYLGSFRNLYKVNLQELLFEHFSEWGDIEELKVFADRGFAFVRYKSQVHAQFAKEAMYCQSLGYNEILNVRWANDDPNPKVIREELERKQKRALEAMEDSGLTVHPDTGYQLPSNYDLPEPDLKRRKITESAEGTHLAFYPNTDQQFQRSPYPPQPAGYPPPGMPPPPPGNYGALPQSFGQQPPQSHLSAPPPPSHPSAQQGSSSSSSSSSQHEESDALSSLATYSE